MPFTEKKLHSPAPQAQNANPQIRENQPAASEDQALLAETIKYATIIVATVPILVLYPFLQKYFVKGVMVGSLKG